MSDPKNPLNPSAPRERFEIRHLRFIFLILAGCLLFAGALRADAATAFYATVYDPYEGIGKVVAIDQGGNITDYATGFEQPEGIVRDSQGNLFVLDGESIWKITAPGVKTLAATKPTPFNSWAMAIDADDNLYVSGQGDASVSFRQEIYKFSAASGYTLFETWDAGGSSLTGLTIGLDGALYASGSDIIRYDATTGEPDEDPYYVFEGAFENFYAFDLAFNAQGDLFVSGWGETDQVLRISADRSTLTAIITGGLSDGRGIALDANGNLFVANWTCGCPGEPNAIMGHQGTHASVFANLGEDFSPNYLLSVAPIPEPSAAALALLGLPLWFARRWLTRHALR